MQDTDCIEETYGRTKAAYRADFKYCYVSSDRWGLKMGGWYTADEMAKASGVSAKLIANRVYSASYLRQACDIIRDEQLELRDKFQRKMFTGYALERYTDWISSHWLRRPI